MPLNNDILNKMKPADYKNIVCGKYTFYPDVTKNRIAEGGLRTKGIFKNSDLKPLVSIITTVKNNYKYMEKAIKSVLNQTYTNIEYIVVDASSSDGTLSIINKYQDEIDYYISEPDHGIYHGMNSNSRCPKATSNVPN